MCYVCNDCNSQLMTTKQNWVSTTARKVGHFPDLVDPHCRFEVSSLQKLLNYQMHYGRYRSWRLPVCRISEMRCCYVKANPFTMCMELLFLNTLLEANACSTEMFKFLICQLFPSPRVNACAFVIDNNRNHKYAPKWNRLCIKLLLCI